jgi:ankyrin repeat protein
MVFSKSMDRFKRLIILLTLTSVVACASNLTDAVRTNDITKVKALLRNHTDANALEPDGTSPLHWAVRGDNLAMVELLLSAGANAKPANRYGVTPLSLAAINGNAEIVEALLKAGADANAKMAGGQTLVMTAARSGNPAVLQKLLVAGANGPGIDVNAREEAYGETALMWAAAENHPEAVKLLVEHGAAVNERSTALQYPKDRFGLEAVITVLPHGSWTALMFAARQGSLNAARALVDAHADLNLTDPDGSTALVLAIINGHHDTAAMLAKKGANPNLADTAGMAALYAATDMSTLGEVFGRPGRKSSDEHSAVDLMRVLLAHGANVNAPLRTPTMFRAHTPGEGILGEGATPLMRAARNGDTAAIRVLLEHGADITARQNNQTTALMLASGLGRGLSTFANEYATDAAMVDAVKVLLDHHADVNAANADGQTALHFAALSLDPVVELLAEHGADLNAKDKQGRTPLDMALGKGGRGRAGAAPVVRESTVGLLRRLISEQTSQQTAKNQTDK